MRTTTRRGLVCSVTLAFALACSHSAIAATTPLSQIGSSGSGAGQLQDPIALVFDPAGRAYVSDLSNKRISVFDSSGAFVRAFGWDVVPPDDGSGFEVCTTATGCIMGDSGGGAGQFVDPIGIVLDGSGRLFVADAINQRINVFDAATSSFTRAYGWDVLPPDNASGFEVCTTATGCLQGDLGGGAGQLTFPTAVALDANGALYVADRNNNRISVFDTINSTFMHSFGFGVATGAAALETCTATCLPGSAGGAAGQLNFPSGVALDGTTLHVADRLNQRISSFALSPLSFLRTFGFAVDTGTFQFESCTTTCQPGDLGDDAGQFDDPTGIHMLGANLLVADSGNERISVFNPTTPSLIESFGFGVNTGMASFEHCTLASSCETGIAGPGLGQFNFPQGLAVDCKGALWVAENGDGDRLQRLGEPGTPLCAPPAAGQPPSKPAKRKKCKRKSKKKPAASAKKRKKCKRKKKR